MRKRYVFFWVLFIMSSLCTACVDYKKAVENNGTNDELGTSEEIKIWLGDYNKDGRRDYLLVKGSTFRLESGAKCVYEIEPKEGRKYEKVIATAIDIDTDNENEIIVFCTVDGEEDLERFNSVYIIDTNHENGKYYLREFPEEIDNVDAKSGLKALVMPQEFCKYSVLCANHVFQIDVSRVYGLNTLNSTDREKLEKDWEKYIEEGYKGEVHGIIDYEIITNSDNIRYIRIYELIKGVDTFNIGQVVIDIKFLPDGTYEIIDVNYKECIDVQS